jgi:hypothetical protein
MKLDFSYLHVNQLYLRLSARAPNAVDYLGVLFYETQDIVGVFS